MLNNITLVGRIAKEIKIQELESGKKVLNVTLSVPRSYKNSEGEYEKDFIPCTLFNGIAENVESYCKQGDLMGIKGRVQVRENTIEIIAEKVTFLSTKKED